MKGGELAAYVEHFRQRVLQDALAEALPAYWERRAGTFAGVGNAACDEVALACWNKAEFLRMYPLFPEDIEEIATILREFA